MTGNTANHFHSVRDLNPEFPSPVLLVKMSKPPPQLLPLLKVFLSWLAIDSRTTVGTHDLKLKLCIEYQDLLALQYSTRKLNGFVWAGRGGVQYLNIIISNSIV